MATSAPGSASNVGVPSTTTSAIEESRSIAPGARTTWVQTRGLTSSDLGGSGGAGGQLSRASIELARRGGDRLGRRRAGLIGRAGIAILDRREGSPRARVHVPA